MLHAHLNDDRVKLNLDGRSNQIHVSLPLQTTAALERRGPPGVEQRL
jgi:hypothetical protein